MKNKSIFNKVVEWCYISIAIVILYFMCWKDKISKVLTKITEKWNLMHDRMPFIKRWSNKFLEWQNNSFWFSMLLIIITIIMFYNDCKNGSIYWIIFDVYIFIICIDTIIKMKGKPDEL